jgi:uncharacterized protein (TIGR04255 family)
MPFPEVERVIYRNNPLIRVICQYRFTPILKIDSDIPADFQDKIRDVFPLYFERTVNRQELVSDPKSEISPDFINLMSKSSSLKNHEFVSSDGSLKANLTRTYIALSTTKYEKWENFYSSFSHIMEEFMRIYNPPFFTRIGLRYTDVFNRTNLGITDVNWDQLINPMFLGILSSPISKNIENFESIYEIKLADSLSKVRIVNSFLIHKPSLEKCFMVDSDFYTSKRLSFPDANQKLEFLHQRATRLIRWIIRDELHRTMNPENI